MFDETQVGWLAGDDYAVAAELRRTRARRPADDRPPNRTDRPPRPDLRGDLLAGRWSDDDPPTAPR